jgi:hypothetical protein
MIKLCCFQVLYFQVFTVSVEAKANSPSNALRNDRWSHVPRRRAVKTEKFIVLCATINNPLTFYV